MVEDLFNKGTTKREAARLYKASMIDSKVRDDLTEVYELLDNVANRLTLLEEKFFVAYLPEDYIIFTQESKTILGANSQLLHYTLDNLCKVMCSDDADKGTLGENIFTTIFYNDEEYKVPVQVLPEIENMVRRVNILLGQSDCTVHDIDYFDKPRKKKKESVDGSTYSSNRSTVSLSNEQKLKRMDNIRKVFIIPPVLFITLWLLIWGLGILSSVTILGIAILSIIVLILLIINMIRSNK